MGKILSGISNYINYIIAHIFVVFQYFLRKISIFNYKHATFRTEGALRGISGRKWHACCEIVNFICQKIFSRRESDKNQQNTQKKRSVCADFSVYGNFHEIFTKKLSVLNTLQTRKNAL